MAEYNSILLIIKLITGVIVIAGITFYVLRPLLKGLSGVEDRIERTRPMMSQRTLQEEELEIPTSGSAEIDNREIVKKALEDPLRTTQLVRNWLREKK